MASIARRRVAAGRSPHQQCPARLCLAADAIEPEQVAEAVVQGLREERFLVLPHPDVAEYFQRKASDYDRWLRGMRRLRARALG
jgi:hypothetical protein